MRKPLVPFIIGGLLLALGLAIFVSPWASPNPDGLEKVAGDKGFLESAEDHSMSDSPLADYGVKGVDDPRISTGLSGLIGVLVTFGVGFVLFGALRLRGPTADAAPARSP